MKEWHAKGRTHCQTPKNVIFLELQVVWEEKTMCGIVTHGAKKLGKEPYHKGFSGHLKNLRFVP